MESLSDYFSSDRTSGYTYTDRDCLEISDHLERDGQTEWAQRPRIYILLRLIGRVDGMEAIVRLGLNDLSLPFPRVSSLPRELRSCWDAVQERQGSVLTESVILENGKYGERYVHLHMEGKDLPYQSLGQLGSGRRAVDRVRSSLSGKVLARKRFLRDQGPRHARVLEEFENELNILKRVDHYHCVCLVASYTDRKHFGLLMSPVADCNLSEFMIKAEKDDQRRQTLSTFFGCLASALDYLHRTRIRHRDIKPDNILVKNNQVYITDFGISFSWQSMSGSTTDEESGKTFNYCAPEVAEPGQKRNTKSDIWSLGCVFLEMLVVRQGMAFEELKVAFQQASETRAFYYNTDTVFHWINTKFQEPRPKAMGPSILELTRRMFSMDPARRPDASEVYRAISTFQDREASFHNPYCGPCCIVEEPSDDELEAEATAKFSPRTPVAQAQTFSYRHKPTAGDHVSRALQADSPSLHRATSSEGDGGLGFVRDVTPENDVDNSSGAYDASVVEPVGSSILDSPGTIPRRLKKPGPTNIRLRGDVSDERRASRKSTPIPGPAPVDMAIPDLAVYLGTEFSGSKNPTLQAQFIQDTPRRLHFEPVMFADLQGRLPRLVSEHWRYPNSLCKAIRSDRTFLKYLGASHPSHANKVKKLDKSALLPVVHLLLYNGLDQSVDIPGEKAKSPLTRIVRSGEPFRSKSWSDSGIQMQMMRLLIAAAELEDGRMDTENPLVRFEASEPLIWAIIRGNSGALRILLEAGVAPQHDPIEATSWYCEIPLYEAIRKKDMTALKLLDYAGARHEYPNSPPVPSTYYDLSRVVTSLHHAAADGYVEGVIYLVESGRFEGKLDSHGPNGPTALFLAARIGHQQIVRYLFDAGADPRASAELPGYNKTVLVAEPLTVAALRGHISVVRVLVEECGVPPDSRPPGACSVLEYRSVSSETTVGKYLISKGAAPIEGKPTKDFISLGSLRFT